MELIKLLIEVETEFIPSKEVFLTSVDKKHKYGVIFEIDSETAYFYSVEMNKKTNDIKKILDACHIFNIKDVTDREIVSSIKIVWSENYHYSLLFINDYVHAIFDFKHKQGYCRTGFPNFKNKESGWSKKDKLLKESFLTQFN